MKVIAMMPVRNEAQLLPTSLGSLEAFCDHILVLLDAQSTDNSLGIARSFAKVEVIVNQAESGASVAAGALVAGRSLLFDAFRSFDGNNIGLCVDADEIAPPRIFSSFRHAVAALDRPGTVFALWWVQLWKSLDVYRADDSVWSNSWKPMAFHDDRRLKYPQQQPHFHESRTPLTASAPQRLDGFPVIHLQWAAWQRTQYKQASLRMLEFVHAGFRGAAEINAKYAATLDDGCAGVKPVEPAWLQDVTIPSSFLTPLPSWHRDHVLALFDAHGIVRFEPLQIWHIAEFAERFISSAGRAPRPHVYGLWASRTRRVGVAVLPSALRALIKQAVLGRRSGSA